MRLQQGLLLATLALPLAAHAQSSQKPIQIIVPFAPGSSADRIGRIVAAELGARLGRRELQSCSCALGGADEIQRNVIARRGLDLPR
jgi:hypothetical protein